MQASHTEATTYDLAAAGLEAEGAQAPGLVVALEPVALFLRELRAVLPIRPIVTCYGAEDGDLYVDLFVPDAAWSNWLADHMSAVTVELLRRTGMYVGLVCLVDPEQAGVWPAAPSGDASGGGG